MSCPKLMSAAIVAASFLAGCASKTVGDAGEPVPAALPAPAPPVASGVISGPLGKSLDEKDRLAASDAQLAAVDSGQKRTWRGARGAFGFVEPGAETQRPEGACREYTHKVYIGGRPQSAKGLACRKPDKGWNFNS